jgi:hypothetical protein
MINGRKSKCLAAADYEHYCLAHWRGALDAKDFPTN